MDGRDEFSNDRQKKQIENDLALSNLYHNLIQAEQKQFKHVMRQTSKLGTYKVDAQVEQTLREREF